MDKFTNLPARQLRLELTFSDHQRQVMGKDDSNVPLDLTFPSEEANRLAAQENYNKHLYRPNTYLHKWWARRSGTTFRYILKQFVIQ